jgi:hypothetical protein
MSSVLGTVGSSTPLGKMTRHIPMRVAIAVAALCGLSACGGARPSSPPHAAPPSAPAPEPEEPPEPEAEEPPPESEPVLAPVRAGKYRLSLSMTCSSREKKVTGKLTLSPVSGGALTGDASAGAASAVAEGALLWGQTDLDLKQFLSCLGVSKSSGEPIHPGVLVEVLRWDGDLHHQVLLVSTDSARGDSNRSAAGVAMWVDRVEGGHIGGVWSRWELMDHDDGRWEAELLSPR